MSRNRNIGRRSVVQAVGATAAASLFGTRLVTAAYGDDTITESEFTSRQLGETTSEILADGSGSWVTSSILGDGFQLYRVYGAASESGVPNDVVRYTSANYGVHNLSFKNEYTLEFSMDGDTYTMPTNLTQSDGVTKDGSNLTKISSDPLAVDYKGDGVVCGQGWCVRLDASNDGHSPKCDSLYVPDLSHGHFAIYPEGNYRGGANFWIGVKNKCVYAGEENYTQWCTKLCGPDGELPSLADLVDLYKKTIRKAADAAGITIPAFVIVIMAYYLAGSTIAPPTGVPFV